MKPSDQEYNLSHGKPHVFKMTLDDGFACYQYDITLNGNWSISCIESALRELLKRYNGSVSCGKLSDTCNSLTPFETLLKHCEEHKIHYRSDADKELIHFRLWDIGVTNYLFFIDLKYESLYIVTWFIADGGILWMDLALPVRVVDKKMQPLVIEALTRANNGLTLGHFKLDMSDGEVNFHISYPIGEAGLEDDTVESLFLHGLYTCERFFPAFMRVIFGGLAPQDAIELAWLDDQSEKVTVFCGDGGLCVSPMEKKARRPRKKNQTPKSGEGTDHPPKGR